MHSSKSNNSSLSCQLSSYKSKHEAYTEQYRLHQSMLTLKILFLLLVGRAPNKGEETQIMGPEMIAAGKQKLQSWINQHLKIEMTDGRILIGMFLCTDRDGNIILGSCHETLNPAVCGFSDEPRLLGLVMVPGRHIVRIHFETSSTEKDST